MADRTPAQIGKANREAGKRAERNGYVYISFADDGCGIGDRS